MVSANSDRVPRAPPYSGSFQEIVIFHLQGFHLLWLWFPSDSVIHRFSYSYSEVLLPRPVGRFGLFPFRSPLLRESIFLSFPLVTKMFQFARFLSLTLLIHVRITVCYYCWVPPFGNLRITAYVQLPEAYRRSSRPSSASSAKASAMRS